jgi:hypothetical protein
VVRNAFGVECFGFEQCEIFVKDMVKRFCKDLFDVMMLMDLGFFQRECMLKRLQCAYPFFGPVVKIPCDDHRPVESVQCYFDLFELLGKCLYGDKIDSVNIDDMEGLSVRKLVVRDEYAFIGDEADLPLVRKAGVDDRKRGFGRGHYPVEIAKRFDIACHRIRKIIQYRGDLFWEFYLLKEQEVAGVLFKKELETLQKLRAQVLFMDIPDKQGKLVWQYMLLVQKPLRENTWCKYG